MATPDQAPIPQYQYQQFSGVVYPDGQHLHHQQGQTPSPYQYNPNQQPQQNVAPQLQHQQSYVQQNGQQVVHEMQTDHIERSNTMSPAVNTPPPLVSHQTGLQHLPAHIPIAPDPLPKALVNSGAQASGVKPSPGATMTYQPKLNLPLHSEWQNSMFGCLGDFFKCKNMNTCCCGMWCPCVLYSRVHYRLRARNPHDLNGFESCNGQCWNSACLGFAVHSRQRDEIRHRYGLPGSCMGDCARHACCSCCTLCQEEKELVYREKELEELVKLNTYQNNQTMMYAPLPNQEKMSV
ncbi:PLAC8 family-domain-containing protein [Peziza echinospora]|nr:PLAC8 family-domain-containing protein [Peziza echinospora]